MKRPKVNQAETATYARVSMTSRCELRTEERVLLVLTCTASAKNSGVRRFCRRTEWTWCRRSTQLQSLRTGNATSGHVTEQGTKVGVLADNARKNEAMERSREAREHHMRALEEAGQD